MTNDSDAPVAWDPMDIWIEDNVESVSWFTVNFKGDPDTWKLFSFWAFFFSVLSYLISGMWRKALVFLGMYILIYILAFIIGSMIYLSGGTDILVRAVGLFLGCFYSVLAGLNFKFDRYRHRVLRQKFWW